jgi:2-polyprenyl-3-methyl-5-hydroxy-6-metoxy-1,4-benzoquinol methylase
MNNPIVLCGICGAGTELVGTVIGKLRQRDFYLHKCSTCCFSFISNPWRDYNTIYSLEYYCGQGIDPLVDYMFELEHPKTTIRQYEWRGILNIVKSLTRIDRETRWLDYGCGNGGLVRYCNEHAKCKAFGFEQGCIKEKASSYGIPYIDCEGLERQQGSFDVVTAIEVLEHLENPQESLRNIRALLKPGGLFFYTTGNAEPFRERLLTWSYIIPEIHISFFEPKTLDFALNRSGFKTEFKGFMPGHVDIIRFKILKNLRWKTPSLLERILPWAVIARMADMKYGITSHPIAWA